MPDIAELLSQVKEEEISETVKQYLRNWIVERKRILWRSLCNCKPDLQELLKLQAEAKVIEILQQDLLLSKLKGSEAKEMLEKIQQEFSMFEK